MIQSHCEQPIEEGKDSDVMKSVSEIIFEGAFQKLANIKKKTQKKKRHDVFSPAHTMPTGVFSLAYHQNLSGKYDSVLYSSHQYHDVTVTAGGKPILIIHQGNNHHTCSNIILMQMFPKSTVYRMTIAK